MSDDDVPSAGPESSITPDKIRGRLAEELREALARGESPSLREFAKRYGLAVAEVGKILEGVRAMASAFAAKTDAAAARTTPSGPPPLPADYEILGELGRGAMGVVYRARQRSMDRVVAVKVLRPGEGLFANLADRFRREVKALAKLRHPHIVAVHEVGESGGHLYFSMDLVEGRSLHDLVQAGEITPTRAVKLLRQVASAIAYTHSHGLVHRDLKPGNILVDEKGDAFVVDFGLARDSAIDGQLTGTGQILGTPAYMSPEQARGDASAIGEASDVYSMGAVLYECLTRRAPFEGRSLVETIRAVAQDEPVAPRKIDARIPRDLEVICRTAMAKEPQRRYPSAQAFQEDIERFVEGLPIRARPASAPERLRRWAARNPQIAASTAALLVMSVGGFAWQSYLLREVTRERNDKAAALVRAGGLALAARSVSLVPTDPGLALALAAEAQRCAPGIEANMAIVEAMAVDCETRRFTLGGCPAGIEFSRDGRYLFGAESGGDLRVWDVESGKPWKTTSRALVHALALSPDGTVLATIEADPEQVDLDVVVRDPATLDERLRRRLGCRGSRSGVLRFSADGRSVWVLFENGSGTDLPAIHFDVASGVMTAHDELRGCKDVVFDSGGDELLGRLRDGSGTALHRDAAGTLHSWRPSDTAARGDELRDAILLAAFFRGGNTATALVAVPSRDDVTPGALRPWFVRAFDVDTGDELPGAFQLRDAHWPMGAAVDRSGSQAAILTDAGVVSASFSATGIVSRALRWSPRAADVVVCSDDGTRIAAVSADSVELLDLPTMRRDRLHGDTFAVRSLAFDTARRRVATATSDGVVCVWDVASPRSVVTLDSPDADAAIWSPESRMVAVSSTGGIDVFDAASGAIRHLAEWRDGEKGGDHHVLAWSRDGRRLLAGLSLFDAASLRPVATLEPAADARGGYSVAAAFSPDAGRVVVQDAEGRYRIHDAADGRLVVSSAPHVPAAECVDFTSDGAAVLALDGHGALLIDAVSGRDLARIGPVLGEACCARLVPAKAAVLVGFKSGAMGLFRSTDGASCGFAVRQPIVTGDREVTALDASPDGAVFASASFSGAIDLWDGRTGGKIRTLDGPRDVRLVRFSPAADRLLAVASDGTCTVFAVADGEPLVRVDGRRGTRSVAGALIVPAPFGSFDATGERFICGAPRTGGLRILPTDPVAALRLMTVRSLNDDEQSRYLAPLDAPGAVSGR